RHCGCLGDVECAAGAPIDRIESHRARRVSERQVPSLAYVLGSTNETFFQRNGISPMCRATLVFLFAVLIAFPLMADQNWPQFRGPSAGVAHDKGLPDEWSASKNVVWRSDIPGRGWSSPIAWDERVFLTTVVNEGKSEEPKKGLYFGGDRPKPSADVHHWMVLCLDWKSGKLLWQREVNKGAPA